jgi:hypothetical protein
LLIQLYGTKAAMPSLAGCIMTLGKNSAGSPQENYTLADIKQVILILKELFPSLSNGKKELLRLSDFVVNGLAMIRYLWMISGY